MTTQHHLWPGLALAASLALAGCTGDDSDDGGDGDIGGQVPPGVLERITFSDSGMIGLGTESGGTMSPGCGILDEEGLDVVHFTWEIPATSGGRPVIARAAELTLTLDDPTNLDSDLFLEGPDGAILGESTAFNVQEGNTETILVQQPLTPGSYTIVVRGCSGTGGFSVNAQADLYEV